MTPLYLADLARQHDDARRIRAARRRSRARRVVVDVVLVVAVALAAAWLAVALDPLLP